MTSGKQTLVAAVAYLQEDERGAFDAALMHKNADAIEVLTRCYINVQTIFTLGANHVS